MWPGNTLEDEDYTPCRTVATLFLGFLTPCASLRLKFFSLSRQIELLLWLRQRTSWSNQSRKELAFANCELVFAANTIPFPILSLSRNRSF
jgi:hypothetical protein